MKLMLRLIIALFPICPRKLRNTHKVCLGLFQFFKNYRNYNALSDETRFPIRNWEISPNLYDRFEGGGDVPKHYFFQDLWASKKVYNSGTPIHYDIGSRLDGFISHCLIFTKVVMIDVRAISSNIKNLEFVEGNGTNLQGIDDGSITSLSSLHAVEHFGLGRYGDPVDPEGYLKAINEIQRVSAGDIFFSVPIGRERLVYDSHRIFDPSHIVEIFDQCDLSEFSYIDDSEQFHENSDVQAADGLEYGCGLFHFIKKDSQDE